MISTGELKKGVVIELEGDLWQILDYHHIKMGRGSAQVRIKFRNVRKQSIVEKTFQAGEKFPRATLERRPAQYLFGDGGDYTFMDTETYDQFVITADQLGEAGVDGHDAPSLADRDALTEWTDVSTSAPTRITPQPSTLPSYRVESATPCVLVLSEVFYPWWRATLDGRTVVPARVNHTMVGVAVPAGTHDIRLSLRPVSLWTGAALSGVSVMGWLFLVVAAIRRP